MKKVPTKCSNLVTPGCQRLLQISINEEDLAKLEQSALERYRVLRCVFRIGI